MSGARFVVLGGHVENVFEYGSQPHVWGLKHEITVYAKLKKGVGIHLGQDYLIRI